LLWKTPPPFKQRPRANLIAGPERLYSSGVKEKPPYLTVRGLPYPLAQTTMLALNLLYRITRSIVKGIFGAMSPDSDIVTL